MGGSQVAERLERIEDSDVGVEIDDLGQAPVEQVAEKQRLDRRRELGDVVDAGQPPDLERVESEVTEPQPRDPVVDERPRIKVTPLVVNEQDREPAVAMVRQKGIGEHRREREVVTRYDGARIQHGWRSGDSLIVLPSPSLGCKALMEFHR